MWRDTSPVRKPTSGFDDEHDPYRIDIWPLALELASCVAQMMQDTASRYARNRVDVIFRGSPRRSNFVIEAENVVQQKDGWQESMRGIVAWRSICERVNRVYLDEASLSGGSDRVNTSLPSLTGMRSPG